MQKILRNSMSFERLKVPPCNYLLKDAEKMYELTKKVKFDNGVPNWKKKCIIFP